MSKPSTKAKDVKRLVLTPGEPAGIGPDLALQIAMQNLPAEIVVVASPDLLLQRAKRLGLDIELYDFSPDAPIHPNGRGKLAILPVALAQECTPGKLDPENSSYVLETLKQAFQLCITRQTDAMVTGPVHKAIICQSGIPFSGHTEYLAQLAGCEEVLMTFYTPSIIVALATTHCPLNTVSTKLTPKRLHHALTLLHEGLVNMFQKKHPQINICGLNPHAGESGQLGSEEQNIMIPVIETLRSQGFSLHGPVPGDTAFTPKALQGYDAILATYHDQGLAPIKALFFGDIVNMTLGLPFLRTSVDHGTALDLAGTGKAESNSLFKAVACAAQFSF